MASLYSIALITLIFYIKYSLGFPYIDNTHGFTVNIFQERHVMRLDPEGKVKLAWVIDNYSQQIIFDLTIATNGFVGFGLNPGVGMTGADMMIGGVHSFNGSIYFFDCFGKGNTSPKIDDHHDWELLDVFEWEMSTSLRFSRSLDTMDKEDVPIKNETINLIWAYGPVDGLNYHEGRRGSMAVNLFEPKIDFSKFKKIGLIVEQKSMPSNTSFTSWCTIFKGPQLSKISHIVAFKALVNGEMELKHVHHLTVSKCWVPPGKKTAELFDKFIGMGSECYGYTLQWTPIEEQKPFHFCQSILYAWGTGQRNTFVPEHMDYLIGEEPNEYYMLETQYYNPAQEKDVKLESGVEVYYTT